MKPREEFRGYMMMHSGFWKMFATKVIGRPSRPN